MKKLKDMIKKNPEPSKPSNTDPGQLGQYSATNLVSEDGSLNTYLSSKGINPKFISRDTKIAHAKSNEFKKWKQNHMFENVLEEDALLDRYLSSRGINAKYLPTDKKIAYAKSNEFLSWKRNHMFEDITTGREKGTDDETRSVAADSPTRQRAEILKKAAKHYQIKTPPGSMKREHGGESQTPQLTPEEVRKPTALEKFRKAADEREKKHKETEKNSGGMEKAIDRLQKHMNKEEVEQIDEISKSTLASYKDKSTSSLKNAQANRNAAEPGKQMSKGFADLHAKSDAIAKKRVKGLMGYMQRKQGMKPTSEDVGDAKAAVNADGLPNPQLEPVDEKKKQMSKSARMIKALYKKHKMVKEDLYDHEKEDKSVATYGKKPKFDKADKDDSIGEKKPTAAATMSGGTTLTGEKRDDVEIDPMMRMRPGQPDPFKKDDKKKDEKDSKKQDKK